MRFSYWIFSLTFFTCGLSAQVLTREDSLQAGLYRSDRMTVLSGYGEAKVSYDTRFKTGEANLTRNVIFLGHKFNSKISLFSELEIEDAKVAGGEVGGEIAMEQLFLKFNINRDIYLAAGLFIPRIGIINENHLPTTFNGVDRPFVETFIIPSTWREIGVGIYGQTPRLQGFNYSLGVYNGLNSAEFGKGTGIREGRFEGRNATASNIAITGAALYYLKSFRFQVSGYFGGSAGLSAREADSLRLDSGPFGTPVILGEASAQYIGKGFTGRILGTIVSIPDADKINLAYANNTPSMMWGAYAEIGFNLLSLRANSDKKFIVFSRYEMLDLNASMPENGIKDEFTAQQYIVAGILFQPVKGVAVKADYVQRMTGTPNPALQINPFINGQQFYASRGFVNLGIAYSF
ncbi:FlxA-like family protein [soil metagenome]